MDLPCVQWQEHVSQKWAGLDSTVKEHFTSLTEIDDVFKFALTLTTPDDLDYLSSLSPSYSVHKDSEQASKCRERGNSSFKNRDYTAAALHYSQGICFSPQNSEQLSLCYANRSAALYHLQHYQKCLEDIDMALKNNYPSQLAHKLKDRQTQCMKHITLGEKENESNDGNTPNYHKDPGRVKAPSGGDHVSWICPQAVVGLSHEKGRHLVAKSEIAAGEVILSDRPYSCVLIPGVEGVGGERGAFNAGAFGTEDRCCHRCLTETLHPVPCGGCSYSRYCSSVCQQDAWVEHHRWECPLGAELMVLGVISQLALRVALKAGLKMTLKAKEVNRINDTESVPNLKSTMSDHPDPLASHYSDSYLRVFHLLHHLNRHSSAVRFLSAVTTATLYLKLSKDGTLPASWDLGEPLTADSQSTDAIEGHAHQITELWLMGSAILRHMLQLRCNTQAIVILKDTGPHSSRMKTNKRQRLLQEQYYFLCQCEACTLHQEETAGDKQQQSGLRHSPDQSGLLCCKCKGSLKKCQDKGAGYMCREPSCNHCMSSDEVRVRLQEIRDELNRAVDLMERDRPGETLQLLNRTCCHAGQILAEIHPLQGEIADCMARACATMGDWNTAAAHLERSATAIISQYGGDSIELGQQLFKLAQLHFNGGARGAALSVIPKVRRLLCLHRGSHCQELRELQAMEDCLRG